MNPRAEADAVLDGRYDVRVLEPSPPAVDTAPWFADDPVAGSGGDGRPVVSPAGAGDLDWEDVVAERPELASWCAERGLAALPGLPPVPPGLIATRLALHRVAESVLAPARRQANGKIGLRFTRGGFGTPFFGADRQLRVVGGELAIVEGDRERRIPITTLAALADGLGPGWLPDGTHSDAGPLDVDTDAADFLGAWFGFAARVLETLRAGAAPEQAPSRVQLWPEHFDLAVELGDEGGGRRAAYGCSPGDDTHPEPYVYVAPWQAPPPGPLWQAAGFPGAELSYAELRAAPEPVTVAVGFLRERLDALSA